MLRKSTLAIMLLLLMVTASFVGCAKPATEEAPVEAPAVEEVVEEATNEPVANEYAKPDSIITVEELNEIKDDVVIIDFTKSGVTDIIAKYIPGAVKVERGEVQLEVNGVKGMNLSQEQMNVLMSKSGIDNSDTVVIYDENNNLWSSRLWWAMKVYGHENVKLLDGGLKAWTEAEFETANDPTVREATNYVSSTINENLVADLEMIKTTYDDSSKVVLDTRSDDEWNDGHIEGAVHLEWNKVINEDGTFKDASTIAKIYEDAGFTKDLDSIVAHCKSGVRATHSMFVLQELLGYENVMNYDGSWIEYSASGEPIVK